MKKQRWINNYNTVGDFDGAKPSFIECHVGGIGAFQKSSTFPAIVDDAPVNDGTYSAAWDAIFNLNRPWRNTPPDDWVGEFDDIVYWMALEIKWGMRGFAIAYDNGNKNRVSGNFDNTNPLNVFTKLPSIDDGNRLVSLSNFLSGNYNCKEISYFDMSNVTSLSNAFSNSVVETFPSIKYNTLKVENISGIFANWKPQNIYLDSGNFPLSTVSNVTDFSNAFYSSNVRFMPLDITKAITIENIYYASKNDGQILNSSNIINISSAPDLTTARQAYYFISNLTVDLSSPYEFPSRINCQNFFGVSPDTVIPSGKLSIKLTVDSSHPDWNWTSSTVPASFNNKSYYLDIQGSDTLKTVTAPLSSVQKGYSNLDLSNCTTVNKLYNTVYLGSTDNMPTYDLSSCTDCSNILNGLTVKDAPTDTIIEGGILDTNIPILTNTGNIKNAANAFYGIKAAWINNPFTNPETSLNNTFAACDKLVTFANKSGDFHLISGNQTGVFNGCTSLKYFKNYTNNDIEIHIEATTTGQSSSIDCSSFFNSCSSLESVTIYMDNILPWYRTSSDIDATWTPGTNSRKINSAGMFNGCTNLKEIHGSIYTPTLNNWYGSFPTMSFDGCDSLEYVDFTEICSNLDMRNCKNLNQACIDKIISALCDFASKPYSNAIPSLTFNAYIGPQQTNIIDNARVAAMQAKGFTVSFLNV